MAIVGLSEQLNVTFVFRLNGFVVMWRIRVPALLASVEQTIDLSLFGFVTL